MAEAPEDQAPQAREGEEGEGVVADALAYVARALVEHPDDVRVERTVGERGPTLRLVVNAGDMGRVIGRNGHIARSIRQVMRAAAARGGEHLFIEITA